MPIVPITMTQFMDFTFASPTRKKGVVRKIKSPDQFPQYYEPVKRAMVHTLYGSKTSGYNHNTDQLETCHLEGSSEHQRRNLRAVASSFRDYIAENRIRNLEEFSKPRKIRYRIGNLSIGIWGDLGARIKNRKYLLKLYLKELEPQDGFDQLASGLFMLAFPKLTEQGIHPRILRVRKQSTIYRAPSNLKEIQSLLKHEADSFLRFWDEV